MRCRHRHSLAGIGTGGRESAAIPALEWHNLAREQARFHDPVREAGRGRAKVFGNHHTSGAVAFNPQHGQHGLQRIIDISAITGGNSGGHQKQARELEGMVNPQRPGMAHIGGNGRAECAEMVAFEVQGVKRRQAPVLPLRGQRVRRRANSQVRRKRPRCGPVLATTALRPDCEIAVEAERQAIGPGGIGRRSHLAVASPLQKYMPVNLRAVRLCKGGNCGRIGRLVFNRPVAGPAFSLPGKIRTKRLINRKALQCLAPLRTKCPKGQICMPPCFFPIDRQHRQLQRPNRWVIHQFSLADTRNCPAHCRQPGGRLAASKAGQGGQIEIDWIEKKPGRGGIGRNHRAIGGKQAMCGAQTRKACSELRRA